MVPAQIERAVRQRQLDAGLLGDGVVLHGDTVAVRRLDLLARLGHELLHLLISGLLILQAAHEAAAQPRNLRRAERKVLLLGHLDGDRVEIVEERFAAHGAAARAEPAEHPRLVAHADLAQLDARVEMPGQILDQLAEVHALVRREVKDHLAAVERVLHVHELHVQPVLGDLPLADVECFALPRGVFIAHGAILRRSHAQHGLERLHDLLVRHLGHGIRHVAEFGAARGLHNHAVAGLDVELAGVKIIDTPVVPEADADHSYHRLSFSSSLSEASTASTVIEPLAPKASRLSPSPNVSMIP